MLRGSPKLMAVGLVGAVLYWFGLIATGVEYPRHRLWAGAVCFAGVLIVAGAGFTAIRRNNAADRARRKDESDDDI